MAENETMEPQVETPDTNYVKIIQDLKRTTVSRDEYNRVLEDNRMLANALATTPEREEESTDDSAKVATDEEVQALRDKLYNQSCGGMSNLDSMETILDLRDAVLSRGDRDPFLPTAEDYVETEEDCEDCQIRAAALRQICDYARTAPTKIQQNAVFNSELKRICR